MPDFTALFQFLSFFCCGLIIYVMQQVWHDPASKGDSRVYQVIRRVAYAAIVLGILLNVSYQDKHSIHATLSEWLILSGIFLQYLIRAIILHQHKSDSLRGRILTTHHRH